MNQQKPHPSLLYCLNVQTSKLKEEEKVYRLISLFIIPQLFLYSLDYTI